MSKKKRPEPPILAWLDVLHQVVEPYLALVETAADRRKLFALAALAWNAALATLRS